MVWIMMDRRTTGGGHREVIEWTWMSQEVEGPGPQEVGTAPAYCGLDADLFS